MSEPIARRFVSLTHAKPGDYVDLHDHGYARVLSIAPNGNIFLQPVGYPGARNVFTINPSLPDTVPVPDTFSPLEPGA